MGHEFTVENINYLGMVAYEYFLQMALLGLLVWFIVGGDAWFVAAMLILPWLSLFLEELTAPFITYTVEQLTNMFYAEAAVRLFYADTLEGWLWQCAFDALYKYVIYDMYKDPTLA